MSTDRRELTAIILSGFCANPAIFAKNANCGWSLVNATDEDIVGYALSLADKVIESEATVSSKKAT